MSRTTIRGLAPVTRLLVLTLAACAPPTLSQQAGTIAANEIVGVASVTDGDTFSIHGQSIRISGIDSPERGKRCGAVNVYQRAALTLSDVVADKTVRCIVNGQSYDRKTARCTAGGVDLAERMVVLGWARDWPRYSGGVYADEEAGARAAKRGIWGLECPANLWGARNYAR